MENFKFKLQKLIGYCTQILRLTEMPSLIT